MAREAFDTAGVARALQIAGASAAVEQAARSSHEQHRREAKNWGQFNPPSATELGAMVWLHKLQMGSAATFYIVLANTLSNEDNLIAMAKYINFNSIDPRKWTYNSEYARYVASYETTAQSLRNHVGQIVPDSEDSTKAFSKLPHNPFGIMSGK
jgi:hypothetical protein